MRRVDKRNSSVPTKEKSKAKNMGFLSWLFGKGIAGAISSNLVQQYLDIKSQYPNEEDERTVERVWNLWLTLNSDSIQGGDDEDRIARLTLVRRRNDKETQTFGESLYALKHLLSLYQDILYIETGITAADGTIWDNSVKVFIRESTDHDLDFARQYESIKGKKGSGRY